ncbi:dialkylresorcinol condensing enzyme DarA [Flavobacterium sp. LMO8]|uniref:dialkylrecorsinol condensing enzyme DarA n=1 Tax=Flavobacterium sp. LMO8 TaxID=2654244 RepID=UPI001290EA3A|nr:dialkylrecorsinol condensing enzyme DarA [Flavobacterium sp. LMO8]MQP23563.1 dialkylresorcinol condensing enzyme DarA [Flavobacterium sp. LMO8]
MKNVLVIHYSQSGQLTEILDNLTLPFSSDEEIDITHYTIEMENDFPFPWKKSAFFNAFPESFLQIPAPIKAPSNAILEKQYDLIILGYQVWYLSPSIPVNSFLKSSFAKQLFKNTPVITVIGARNMWVKAQEKMKVLLLDVQANLVGNIALVDRNINHISVVTIVHWMFSGKKTKYLGIFPLPGVADSEIKNASKFGNVIKESLLNKNFNNLQDELLKLDAVEIRPFLVEMDKKANKMFKTWSNFIINKKKSREFWLKVFNAYLWVAIWVISPIVFILHLLKYPFIANKIAKEKALYKKI